MPTPTSVNLFLFMVGFDRTLGLSAFRSGNLLQIEQSHLDQCTTAPNVNDELVGALPKLRVFALSMCTRSGARVERAEDLVQETVTKALANIHLFVPGTNMMRVALHHFS